MRNLPGAENAFLCLQQNPVDTGVPPLDGHPALLQLLNGKQLTSRPNNCKRVSRVDGCLYARCKYPRLSRPRNGSALNWYAIPPNANLRYLRCLWWIGMWKYASFKSIVINQSFSLMNCTSRCGVSILNRSGMSALFNTRRSNIGQIGR